LPVVQDGDLVGIVSDRDLKRAMASSATLLEAHELSFLLNRLTMSEIMTGPVITVIPTLPVEEAAAIMLRERISALPVTEAGRMVGIVTETDLIHLLVQTLGAEEPSSRIDVLLPPDGNLTPLVETIEAKGGSIMSLVMLRARTGSREAVVYHER
jgi:acetoin utilization protein AcuB